MAKATKKAKKSKNKILNVRPALLSKTGLIYILVFAAVGGVILIKSLAATPSSIVVNQSNVQYGQTVTLTAVYPSDARKKIGRRQMFQPQIDMYCLQNSARVFFNVGTSATETNLGNGLWQGVSTPFTLGGSSWSGQYNWPGGSADCTGYVGYYTTNKDGSLDWHTLATVDFHVN